MNRTTLIYILAGLLLTFCDYASAQIETINDVAPIGMSDRENAQLYGEVISIKESIYKADFSRRVVEKGEFITSHKVTYNSAGNEVSDIKLDIDGTEGGKTITQYNEEGFKRVTTEYNELGDRIMQTLYSFTADGLCAKTRLTDAMAITMATSEVSHGDKWASVSMVYVGAFGEDTSESRFEYDNKGRIEKSIITTADNTTIKQAKLDSNGHAKTILTTVNGKTESKKRYTYVLDHRNNWTESVEYVDNKPVEVRYRTIEYKD